MKWQKWLENWNMTSLKITVPFLEMEWNPQDEDKAAAWEMYIELLTRITTQPLNSEDGDEKTALDSVHLLFATTREIIKRNGRNCIEFTKIAVVVLNQIIRPFTAKWHKKSFEIAFANSIECKRFRNELTDLQKILNIYTQMLGQMAGVEEDLTKLEDN
tara:strand:+ start:127 stop:603 length:477 start_codon:yes stop_codon:yes gene_type:complete